MLSCDWIKKYKIFNPDWFKNTKDLSVIGSSIKNTQLWLVQEKQILNCDSFKNI